MLPRRTFTGLLVAAGSFAGSTLYRRRAARRIERVDLYAENGSLASFTDETVDANRTLELARELIAMSA